MQAALVPSRIPRALVAVVTVSLAVLIAGAAASVVTRSSTGSHDRIALATIPPGASLQHVGDRAVAFVRDGEGITAFVPAIPVGDALVWCRDFGFFATALHASHYSLDGTRISGPGPLELPRYATSVAGADLLVSTSHPFDVPTVAWTDALANRFTEPSSDVCSYGLGTSPHG